MKYALLVYPGATIEAIGRMPESEQIAVMSEYRALAQEPGVYASEQLQSAEHAKTVRVDEGQRRIGDGTVANESIAGLYLVEADDIDRALELAERIPAARLGGVIEVRPLVER